MNSTNSCLVSTAHGLIMVGPNGDIVTSTPSTSSAAAASTSTSAAAASDADDSSSTLRLPLAKLRQLVKLDPDVQLAAQDAVFAIGKATEMFIELLATVSCLYRKPKTTLK